MQLINILNSPLLRLSTADRYSGIYLARKDTVSDHTTQVGLIALLIANNLNQLGLKVDYGQIALKALTHDIDESITCDVPRNVKYFNEDIKNSLDKISDISVKKIAEQHQFPELYDLWDSSKNKTIEGFTIKIADMIHVIVKLREELVVLNNMHMLKVLIEIDEHLTSIQTHIRGDKFSFEDSARGYFMQIVTEALGVTSSLKTNYQQTMTLLNITTQVISGN